MLILRVIIIHLLFIPFFSFAGTLPSTGNYKQCFVKASERFQIDHRLLIAIADVESSMNPKAINLNKRDGKVVSEDVGIMQINSSWFPKLAKMGITRNDLLNNPCQNIFVGAWILAANISSNGISWESVGAYNTGFRDVNAPIRMKYAKKVYAKYIILTGGG